MSVCNWKRLLSDFVHYVDQKETADNVQLHGGTLFSSQSNETEANSGAEIASNFKCSTIPFTSVSISARDLMSHAGYETFLS